jgi:hypothetical protein
MENAMRSNVSLLRELAENIRRTGLEWATRRRELAALQNRRKAVQVEVRDRLLAGALARGDKLSQTAAGDDARAHPEYVACLDEIALKQFEVDAAEVAYTTARALFHAAASGVEESAPPTADVWQGERSAAA